MPSFRRVVRGQLFNDFRLADAPEQHGVALSTEGLLALQAMASRSSPLDLFAVGEVIGRPYIAPYTEDVVRRVTDGFVSFEKSHAVFSVSQAGMLATLRSNAGSLVKFVADPSSGEIFDVLATGLTPGPAARDDWPLYDSLRELQRRRPPSIGPLPKLTELKRLQSAVARQPHIPFDYLRDGCTVRAEAMCSLLIDHLNVDPRLVTKIWISCTDPNDDLELKTDLSPMCAVRWSWHVAPLIETETGFYVIDPPMSDVPLKRSNWGRRMNVPKAAARFQYSSSARYYHSEGLDASPDVRKKRLLGYLRQFNDLLSSQIVNCGPLPYSSCWVNEPWRNCTSP